MLPLGLIKVRGEAGHDERQTMVTLWSLFRSPLMIGCDLTRHEAKTLALWTHPELLRINQTSRGNDELPQDAEHSVRATYSADVRQCWLTLFNLSEAARPITIDLAAHGLAGLGAAVAVWSRAPVPPGAGRLSQEVTPHALSLNRLQRG